jgi:hypothetical protein
LIASSGSLLGAARLAARGTDLIQVFRRFRRLGINDSEARVAFALFLSPPLDGIAPVRNAPSPACTTQKNQSQKS